MADIYENAFLTIAATASKDSNGGCFSEPNSSFRARRLKNSILHVAESHPQDNNINRGWIGGNFGAWPLLDRAWVYQERRLSTRVVHFTDVQLLWECRCTYRSESGDINEDWPKNKDILDKSIGNVPLRYVPLKYPMVDALRAWHQIVGDYSRLQLTFAKDRLPALAAVVQRIMRSRHDDTYIAGVWRSSLVYDLMWTTNVTNPGPRPLNKVPSWTWASAGGPVEYTERRSIPIALKIGCKWTHVGPPQLGRVIDAAMTVMGYSCRGMFGSRRGLSSGDGFVPEEADWCLPLPRDRWTVDGDYDFLTGDRPVKDDDTVFVVMIRRMYHMRDLITFSQGIVLRHLVGDEYERIGLCRLRLDDCFEGRSRVSRRPKVRDNFVWRCHMSLITSLPVREFKIV